MRCNIWLGVGLLWGLGCAIGPPSDQVAAPVEMAEALVEPELGSYLGLVTPGVEPTLFMPQLLVEGQIEHGGVFSPDGMLFFYTVSDPEYADFDIMFVERQGAAWSAPRKAPFSTAYSEHGAFFVPGSHQLQLLVSSTRPRVVTEESPTWNLWSLTHDGTAWSEPGWIRLPGMEGRWTSHGTVTDDGVLYFHALGSSGDRDFDLYRALPEGGSPESSGYGPPLRLGPAINTEGIEVTAWVATDESFLLFAAYDRAEGHGQGDLYISHRDDQGEWGVALNLGSTINTEFEESNPTLTPNGNYLIFSSGRPLSEPHADKSGLHLYWVRADVLELPSHDPTAH